MSSTAPPSLPEDDPRRDLTVVDRDHPDVAHIYLAGDTYSLLIGGEQTAGRYCLIDMHIPDGGGPPPHRHDFEEMFVVLEGEIEFTFRGEPRTVAAGSTVNVPANAPHFFRNSSGRDARMLCMCAPAGQEEYFSLVGDRLESRQAPPPDLDEEQLTARRRKAVELSAQFSSELLV